MRKTIAVATIGGATLVVLNSIQQIVGYKKNTGMATTMAVITLLVGISAINYSVNKIKYE
jgi:hypothetical protein